MAETRLKRGAISPTTPPQISQSSRPPSVKEVVAKAQARGKDGEPHTGLLAPARCERLLRRFRWDGTNDRLAPYLLAADALLELFVGEVSTTAGECGPIAASVLHTAAWQKGLGVFYADIAASQDPVEAVRLNRMAGALQTESRQNVLAALDLSVKIARSKPAANADPLAAQMAAVDAASAEEPESE